MNWQKIRTDYPEAYDKYIIWNCAKNPNCPSIECYEYNERDLYDYFDDSNIYIFIKKENIGSDEWVFYYCIEHLSKECENAKRRCKHFEIINSFISSINTYKGAWETRKEAEKAAFKKAFEILNNKLK